MRVLCCPANSDALSPRPHPKTLECLNRDAPDAEIVDVTGNDNGYWEAVRERWTGDDDLIIVEHDMSFTSEQFQSLVDCPGPWCLFPYLSGTGRLLTRSIGFSRFRKEHMARVPISQIPTNHDGTLEWDMLDGRLYHASWRFGFRPHLHEGMVGHFHEKRIANA